MTFGECEVLVIEDEPLVALMLEDMLLELGCSVAAVTHDVTSAWEALGAHSPHVVVMDFELGKGNSLDLISACRERGIAIVLATGYTSADLPAAVANVPLVAKPFSTEQLSSAIQQALAGRATA